MDKVITQRQPRHSHGLTIRGESYGLREKQRSALSRPDAANALSAK